MSVKSITVGPGVLTIGPEDALATFSEQVTSCKLTPKVDTSDPVNVLSGAQLAGDRDESWTLNGKFVQDFGNDGSTTEWLFNHRGEQHPFTYVPNTSRGRKISGTITVEAVEIGGDVKTKPTSDFEFALIGPPVLGAAAGSDGGDDGDSGSGGSSGTAPVNVPAGSNSTQATRVVIPQAVTTYRGGYGSEPHCYFEWTAPATGQAVFSTIPSPGYSATADTALFLWELDGSNNTSNQILDTDSGGNGYSKITTNVVAGKRYLLDCYNDHSGQSGQTYQLNVPAR